jgi:methionyl-tRNA formyltransferase
MQAKARIIFAGTPEFAVPTLRMLLDSQHTVVATYTQPDRPAGRGRKLQPGPVKQLATDAGVQVMQPAALADSASQAAIAALQPDLLVVVAYGLLLPPEVLAIPSVACVNVHASLLPRWRGASPIQTAILTGDAETGVSLMQMDAGLDTGPVFCAERVAIAATETAGELHDRLAQTGATMLGNCLDAILAEKLQPAAQPAEGATYAGRISKADAVIDWTASATAIDRLIRAYNPWPVAESSYAGEQLRCWRSRVVAEEGSSAPPGTVLTADDKGIRVQAGRGTLQLTEVQAPGRKRVTAAEFANARPLAGAVLGQ